MPTKDAVIVNAPRELEVPTFSKQEIVKFVGDADQASDYEEVIALVNEGLQKGDIVVEGGGTKLYSHVINGPSGNSISIISTVYSGDDIDAVLNNCIKVLSSGGPVLANIFDVRGLAYSQSYEVLKQAADSSNVIIGYVDLSSIFDSLTDTVTEL